MSLQVWLPLNGDLHNQGLSNCVFTNGNAVVDNNGKIGKCYSFSSENSSYLSSTLTLSNTGPWSASAWVYPTTSSSGGHQYIVGLNSTNSTFLFDLCWYGNKFGIRLGSTTYQSTTSYALNAWYHVAFSYNGSQIKLYINGILDKTQAFSSSLNNYTNLYIGKRGGNAGYFSGKLNDIRIYDHALSDKEVKEIAKGLVLHYKLDSVDIYHANENFILESHKVISGGNAAGITREYMSDGSMKIIAASGNSNYASLGFAKNSNENVGAKLSVGDTYTISCEIKVEVGSSLPTLFINNGNGYKRLQGTIILNKWIQASYTSTWAEPGTNYGNISLHLGFSGLVGTYYFKNFKLEKSASASAWSPAPGDDNYQNLNIVYDVSGYNNNATPINTVTTIDDTFRYNASTHLINGSYIRLDERPGVVLPTDAITVNFWMKYSTWGNPVSCTEGGGWNIENSSGLQFPIYVSGSGYKIANSGVVPGTLANDWHMITGTFDRATVKIYIDGELKKSTDTGTTNGIGYANNYLFLGAEASGNTATPASSTFVGNLSDFRIYATALSEEDILDLYHTPISIDNKGNIYTRELVEI